MLDIVLSILRALSLAARNENLDIDEKIPEIIDYVGDLIELGDDAREKLEELQALVESWVEENRNPTDAELATLSGRAEDALDRLRNAREARDV